MEVKEITGPHKHYFHLLESLMDSALGR